MPSSTSSPTTVLVVPCYNEAERLDREAFERFATARPELRLVLVDDGSTDGTAELLAALVSAHPESFEVLTLERHSGKAEAVRAGMRSAARRRPQLIGFWDADLSTPLEELDGFLEVLSERPGIEMVFGARVGLMGRSIHRTPFRHYVGRVFATLISNALRLPIYDTQCGAKLFRSSADLDAVLEEPFVSRWIFDVEMIGRFAGLRAGSERRPVLEVIYELPLHHWRDVGGSKIGPRESLVIGLELLRVYRRLRRRRC